MGSPEEDAKQRRMQKILNDLNEFLKGVYTGFNEEKGKLNAVVLSEGDGYKSDQAEICMVGNKIEIIPNEIFTPGQKDEIKSLLPKSDSGEVQKQFIDIEELSTALCNNYDGDATQDYPFVARLKEYKDIGKQLGALEAIETYAENTASSFGFSEFVNHINNVGNNFESFVKTEVDHTSLCGAIPKFSIGTSEDDRATIAGKSDYTLAQKSHAISELKKEILKNPSEARQKIEDMLKDKGNPIHIHRNKWDPRKPKTVRKLEDILKTLPEKQNTSTASLGG